MNDDSTETTWRDVDALYETASLVSYSTENILDVAAAARAAP